MTAFKKPPLKRRKLRIACPSCHLIGETIEGAKPTRIYRTITTYTRKGKVISQARGFLCSACKEHMEYVRVQQDAEEAEEHADDLEREAEELDDRAETAEKKLERARKRWNLTRNTAKDRAREAAFFAAREAALDAAEDAGDARGDAGRARDEADDLTGRANRWAQSPPTAHEGDYPGRSVFRGRHSKRL